MCLGACAVVLAGVGVRCGSGCMCIPAEPYRQSVLKFHVLLVMQFLYLLPTYVVINCRCIWLELDLKVMSSLTSHVFNYQKI